MKKTLATLSLTVVILLGMGIVLLASASTLQAQRIYGAEYGFFKRQIMWILAALAVGGICCKFDYHNWKNRPFLPKVFYGIIAIMLVLTLIPGIRMNINGSYRWLVLGPVTLQPGEFAKLAIVITGAVWLSHIGWRVQQFWRGAIVPAVLLTGLAALLFLERDLGALMVVGVLGGTLMFVAGTPVTYMAGLAAPGAGLVAWKVLHDNVRMPRIDAWMDVVIRGVENHSREAQHLKQSLFAFMSGGPWGVGFNESFQKHYLPEAHTDFIAAIGGEEMGFFFSIGIVACYAILLICGILISLHAPDRMGRLLAIGMTMLLVFQGAFNIAVVTGCLPTKGLALPFISYGGSNLLTALFAVGTLFNIGMHIGVHDERIHTSAVRDAVNEI
ncbi:MAG: putative lipid II flippase FtsW [Kiritimatiellaeota bacterium]|nr:putative lipid II flippase FtsW [Kiritimatiellota bacterium]